MSVVQKTSRKSIQECIKAQSETTERNIKYIRKQEKEAIEKIESNFQICPILEAEGFDCILSWHGETLRVNIKEYQLPQIAKIAQCHFEKTGMCAEDKKKRLVEVKFECEKYPGLRVYYVCKLPKGSQCKIKTVKSSYTEVVCEVPE